MTNTVSHLCGFADTTNTGVPAGTTLYNVPNDITGPTAQTGSGWTYNASGPEIDVSQGGVLKNVSFYGAVAIQGDATIEDSDLSNSGENGWVIAIDAGTNITIAHNSLHGTGTTDATGCDTAIRQVYPDGTGPDQVPGIAANMVVENNNIWDCYNGLNNIEESQSIEQNYLHDFGNPAGTGYHVNGMQIEEGNNTNILIQDNTVLNDQDNVVIAMSQDAGAVTNRTINHNLLAGGNYCFHGGDDTSTGPPSSITFTHNSFSRMYDAACGADGTVALWYSGNGNVWSGNIWDDTGAGVSP